MVEALLRAHRCDPSPSSALGWTPLHDAAEHGHAAVVRALAEAGCRMDATTREGWHALHAAAQGGHAETAAVLLQMGCARCPADERRATPLSIAACSGSHKVVEVLLTPFSIQRSPRHMHPHPEQIDQAQHAHHENQRSDRYLPEDLSAALCIAAERGHHLVAELLLAAGASPDLPSPRSRRQRAPLHLACAKGHHRVAELLLAAGCLREARSADGKTALFAAARGGHAQAAELLLRAGCDADTASPCGESALAVAARNGHAAAVEQLLAAGAAGDTTDPSGASPVYLAACRGHLEVVRLLATAGCRVDLVCAGTGMAARAQAQAQGHAEVAALLRWREARGGAPPLRAWRRIVAAAAGKGGRRRAKAQEGYRAQAAMVKQRLALLARHLQNHVLFQYRMLQLSDHLETLKPNFLWLASSS